MTYFLCNGKGHYVQQHRGEHLSVGDICPARDCGSKLVPAPEADEVEPCPRPGCNSGILTDEVIDGQEVKLCCACGRTWHVPASEAPTEGVTKARPKTGAERVAEHRARRRAEAQARVRSDS